MRRRNALRLYFLHRMGRVKLRQDKKCQNCGRFVAERFCPHCGQENVETRQPFYHLFTHFVGDIVHYDSLFWRTIINLYRPAKLPQAYISGKRNSYVSPFRLYIFISFLVFFIPAILPDRNETQDQVGDQQRNVLKLSTDENNKITVNIEKQDDLTESKHQESNHRSRRSTAEKLKNLLKGEIKEEFKEINALSFTEEELREVMMHHFPKAIFLYMPVFAFWLWIFHNKKKWMYFDHGIYTLHYFSFLLLTILLYILINWLLTAFHSNMPGWITFAMLCYFIYYFFHSHRLMYQETKATSRTKCVLLFFINTLCMLIFVVLYFVLIIFFVL